MILINIAILITLIGLGVFSYGITLNISASQDEILETILVEEISESASRKVEKELEIIADPTDESLMKADKFLESINDLEEKISVKKNNLGELTNEAMELNFSVESLRTEKENLLNEISEFKLEVEELQKIQEEKLAITGELAEVKAKYERAIELTGLLQENEELKSALAKQDIKILSLEQKISKNGETQASDNSKLIEEAKARIENLMVEMEKLQKELVASKEGQLTSDKLLKSQKTQILEIRAMNLELEAQLDEGKNHEKVLSVYNGVIATFEGNLVYEPNKKRIILVTPEGIEFTIIQDDFPGDLVAKCGLPVSSSSEDRCFATISAQMLVEDNQLMLKGKEIKEITKK